MGFIEKNLSTNEHILYKGSIHWLIYGRALFFIIVGILCGSVSYALCGFLVFVGLISLAMAFSVASSSEFAVTNRRVIFKTGIIKRQFIELQLNRSEGLVVEQGIMGRIFNFGTLKITSGGVTEKFPLLSKPFEFKKQVNNAVEGSFTLNVNPANY